MNPAYYSTAAPPPAPKVSASATKTGPLVPITPAPKDARGGMILVKAKAFQGGGPASSAGTIPNWSSGLGRSQPFTYVAGLAVPKTPEPVRGTDVPMPPSPPVPLIKAPPPRPPVKAKGSAALLTTSKAMRISEGMLLPCRRRDRLQRSGCHLSMPLHHRRRHRYQRRHLRTAIGCRSPLAQKGS